ncbi:MULTISPECIES: flagellin [unclassified Methylobacterium]|uniref:flagellin N-terminal helical domain-containing protein n=1 Tax=unclassified Methylobacterium TaxID=2615210 RepID=UPI00226A8D22|nr:MULTISPECIES: flagellin [unclassified Methylobacterium]
MSSYDITLSSATRQNLLSLQDTAALASTNQNRLATGKKVNSALDNPVNFFTSQSLTSRSSDLSSLLDGISNGVQAIQAANQGITSIQKLVDQAKSIGSQALASKNNTTTGEAAAAYTVSTTAKTVEFTVDGATKTANIAANATAADAVAALNTAAGTTLFSNDSGTVKVNGTGGLAFADAEGAKLGFAASNADLTVEDKTRTALVAQFNSLRGQIDQLANDASYNGINLINSDASSNKLHVSFNEKDSSSLDVAGVDLSSTGLGIASATSFQSDTDVNTAIGQLTTASNTLRAQSSTFGSNLTVVQNRQDFSKQLINILQTGSDNLTNADMNAEAANSQALSTRQSLGVSALSLANTAQQGVLQLLR